MPADQNVLIIVQNLPVPFDRRVWQEAVTLRRAGFGVTVICPKRKSHILRSSRSSKVWTSIDILFLAKPAQVFSDTSSSLRTVGSHRFCSR